MDKKFNYPNYNPVKGNLTEKIINKYINYRIKYNLDLDYNNLKSLIASNNPKDEIYFWQLYSILGKNKIKNIVEHFYYKIFNSNKNDWFKMEFIESGDLTYHIKHQTNYWLDIMGYGPSYFGGEELLNYKHNNIKKIMNSKGSKLWIKYILETLFDLNYHKMEDKRIFITLKEFIYFNMYIYSKQFNFDFYYNSKL